MTHSSGRSDSHDALNARAGELAGALAADGVRVVAMTWVDNAGLELRMAFEVEWFVGLDDGDGTVADCSGPGYGMTRVVELSDYLADIVEAMAAEGVPVEQLHPEYATGQMELSVAATDPVAAADRQVLVRETIRAVSQAHHLRASFAPMVVAGQVGNGGHLHLSVWAEGRNLLAGGDGPHGLTPDGQSGLTGLLDHLPPCARWVRRAWPAISSWCHNDGRGPSSAGAGRTGKRPCASSPEQEGRSRRRPTPS